MKKSVHQKIGLVGVGNMGTSILEGALKNGIASPSQIWVYDKVTAKAKAFAKKTGVKPSPSLKDLMGKVEVILIAMKPQDFGMFAAENKKHLCPGQVVISILAGMTTEKIRKGFGKSVPVIRVMPNLGAKLGESMTVLSGKDKKGLSFAETFFSGCGKVAMLPEKAMDLVTAMSGSGPAYFFYLMELLADFGVKQGLSPKVAATLAVQTAVGAALLARSSKYSCAQLRQMVTSKKGTTEAALKVLKKGRFGTIFQQGLSAAMKRSFALRTKTN